MRRQRGIAHGQVEQGLAQDGVLKGGVRGGGAHGLHGFVAEAGDAVEAGGHDGAGLAVDKEPVLEVGQGLGGGDAAGGGDADAGAVQDPEGGIAKLAGHHRADARISE